MFRFSQEYLRQKSGLYLPPEIDQEEHDEYLSLVESMSEDFKAGRVTDLLIDDRDITPPENFVDFYWDKGESLYTPFPKQVQAAINTLQEYCTNTPGRISCTDVSYAQEIPTHDTIDQIREKITFLKHGKCPTCGKTRMDQWNEGNTRKDLLVMVVGQRAGKDRAIGLIGGYLHARYLTLRNLSRAYKLGEGTTFYTTFTATTQTQALKATFTPFADIITNHPWLKKYHEMLDYSGQKAGKELYKIGKENIAWPHHGLAVSVEAPDDRNLRGSAKIYGSITEFSFFYSSTRNSVKFNGPQIFKAMNNSFATVKMGYRKCVEDNLYDMPPPLFANASSPRSYKDGIMSLYRTSKTTPSMYGMHYSTFDFNPEARESDFATEKAFSLEGYRTDYLALPADAIRAFIKSRRLVSGMPDDMQPNAVRCKSIPIKSGSGLRQTSGVIEFRKNNSLDFTTPKVLGLDMGVVANSASGVVAHVEQDGEDETVFFTVVDAIFEVIPLEGTRINFRRLYEDVIYPICAELNVQFMACDRWETERIINDLDEDLDIQATQYKCTYKDFTGLRAAVDDKRILLPKSEINVAGDPIKNIDHIFTMSEVDYPHCFNEKPIAHLLYQLLTVEDIMNKTVDKGENSTDDIFRSLVLTHKFCHEPEIRDTILSLGSDQETADTNFEMVSVGFDGRVMDKKTVVYQEVDAARSRVAQESFGIVVPFK